MGFELRVTLGLDEDSASAVARLEDALDRNTAALDASTEQGVQTMASIQDLTDVATAIADDDSALKSAIDNLVDTINGFKPGLSPADQAALDAAVTSLQTAHSDLVTQASDATATPPVAP